MPYVSNIIFDVFDGHDKLTLHGKELHEDSLISSHTSLKDDE